MARPMDPERFERVEVTSADALWRWLASNHGWSESVWLVTYKAADRSRYVSREEVLDALIAYGWIDGRRLKLDEQRTMQLISPRRQQAWARTYQQRAARLESEGRMRAPGRAAIERAQASGAWDSLAAVDELVTPHDLEDALRDRDATDWWSAAAPSYRRNALRWIETARRPETRARRVAVVADHAARGERVPNY